jgi:hypothetical protein
MLSYRPRRATFLLPCAAETMPDPSVLVPHSSLFQSGPADAPSRASFAAGQDIDE